jgi:hypothetical protein
MTNTERDMNFYPGRKVMFLKIKNKFRFVSIFLLLASLVTIVSSASADEYGEVEIPFTVGPPYDCTVNDEPATWSPINATGDLVVNPGDEVTVTADPQFEDGWTECDYYLDVTGHVTSDIELPPDWTGTVECNASGNCEADPMEQSVEAFFTVPSDAQLDDYMAILYLTWVKP